MKVLPVFVLKVKIVWRGLWFWREGRNKRKRTCLRLWRVERPSTYTVPVVRTGIGPVCTARQRLEVSVVIGLVQKSGKRGLVVLANSFQSTPQSYTLGGVVQETLPTTLTRKSLDPALSSEFQEVPLSLSSCLLSPLLFSSTPCLMSLPLYVHVVPVSVDTRLRLLHRDG